MCGAEGFEELGRFFIEHNPFAVKNDKKKVLSFETYTDIYLYVLKKMSTFCKRGYVDMPVLIRELTQMETSMCMEINEKIIKTVPALRTDVLMVDWEDLDISKRTLANVMKGLHCVTDSDFDYNQFEMALFKYKQFIKENNGKTKNN